MFAVPTKTNIRQEYFSVKKENVGAAQKALVERARLNRLARRGDYTVAMETPH